jgi:hypothetical protein
MAKLLSGSTLRRGGSGTFVDLKGAQPQLPPTDTTSTGYTVVTDSLLRTSYRSSLGNLEIHLGEIYNNIPDGNIVLTGTGTGIVFVSSSTVSTSTDTGALVVAGGLGIGGALWTGQDINVNGLTIGQGWQGLNNIVIKGVASPQITEFSDGQESIVIGYDALKGLDTSYKNIAIGSNALSSGTSIANTIAIGDSALKLIGTVHKIFAANITAISLANPVVLTVNNHNLTTGTYAVITDIIGTTELNDLQCYIDVLTPNTVALYSDNILNSTIDGTSYTPYVSGGNLSRSITQFTQNSAIGVDSGRSLIEGEQNFFFGVNSAKNLTTGSYNLFFGHDVGKNMITGNSNISIGGDNLVDGVDNQVNIGGVFYYNGQGYTQFNSDVGMGVGTTASSVAYAAMTVYGGLGITSNTIMGGPLQVLSTVTSTSSTTGALTVTGGAGISGDLYVGSTIVPSLGNANNGIVFPSNPGGGTGDGASIKYYILDGTIEDTVLEITASDNIGDCIYLSAAGKVLVTNDETSNSDVSGALQIIGGVGIGKDVYVGGSLKVVNGIDGTITTATNIAGGAAGSIPYQSSQGTTNLLAIGTNQQILISTGTLPEWVDFSSLTSSTATNSENVFVNDVSSEITYYLGLTEQTGDFSPVDSDTNLTYVTTTATTSTYFTSGTSVLNVPGSIYSIDGNADIGNLLYTPKFTVASIPHSDPRPGDVWIDTANSAFYHWIIDAGNAYWLQISII